MAHLAITAGGKFNNFLFNVFPSVSQCLMLIKRDPQAVQNNKNLSQS